MKIHFAFLRRVGIAGTAAALLVQTHAGPLVNGSFELGLTGWTVTNYVDPSNLMNGPMSATTSGAGPYFSPVDGSQMLLLAGGRGSSIIVSQTFTLYSGQLLTGSAGVSGEAAFDSPVPFFINGLVTLKGAGGAPEQILWDDTLDVQPGQAFYPPWHTWSATAPQTGDYTLQLIAANAGFYGETARFDNVRIVPDAGPTAWLFGATLALLAGLRGLGHARRRLRACALAGIPGAVLGATVFGAPITNGGFENGLIGWSVTITPSLDSRSNSSSATTTGGAWGFVPVEGNAFAELQPTYAGQVTLTQTFTMGAGEYLSGYAGAIAPAPAVSYPSEVRARVTLSGPTGNGDVTLWSVDLLSPAMPAPPVDAVAPWERWTYTAPNTGAYTLQLTAQSGYGGGFAMFDHVNVPDTMPTLAGLLAGLGVLAAWRPVKPFRGSPAMGSHAGHA